MSATPTIPDPEALLAHGGFVRAVARGLLFDENRVDDVVQETFLRALVTGPRQSGSLKSWLRTVARNVALSMRRSDESRRLREIRAVEQRVEPFPEDILQQEELRRHVVRAVFELTEPYRTVILLRHYRELPLERIAEQLGVPEATVWTRLHRARQLLRKQLDRDHDDDRTRWTSGMIAIAGLEQGTAAVASTAALSGTLMMKVMIAAGVLLLLTVGTLLLALREPKQDTNSPGTAVAAMPDRSDSNGAQRTAKSLEREATPVVRSPVDEPTVAPVDPRAVLCRILSPAGDAIHDAEVLTRPTQSEDDFALIGQSDAEGRIAVVPPDDAPVDLQFRADGFVTSYRHGLFPGQQCEVFLHPGITVHGRVVDAETDAPIEGVKLQAKVDRAAGVPLHRETGPDGSFEIVLPSLCYELRLSHLDYIKWISQPFRADPGGEPLHVRLPRTRTFPKTRYVRVLDRLNRRPIEGVEFQPGPAEAMGEGLYRVECRTDLFESRHGFQVHAPGFIGLYVWASKGSGRQPLAATEILLPRPSAVCGIVLDPSGRPVQGAVLQFRSGVIFDADMVPDTPWSRSAKSDSDGRYRIDGLAPPELIGFTVVVSHPEFTTIEIRHLAVPDAPPYELDPIHLARGCCVRGRVLRAVDRTPVVGARVKLERSRSAEARITRTDAEGRFVHDHVGKKAWLTVEADGLVPWKSSCIPGEVDLDETILLDEGLSICGVVEDHTGTPVPGASVRARIDSHARNAPTGRAAGVLRDDGATARADHQGRFRIEGLIPGPYLLAAARDGVPGTQTWSCFTVNAMAGDSDIRVTLEALSGVLLRMIRARDGQPVLQSRVAIAAGPGSEVGWGGRSGMYSNAAGTHFVELSPASMVNIMVESRDLAPLFVTGVSVETGEIREVVCRLEEPASLRGVVRRENGIPMADVTIHLALRGLKFGEPFRTDVSERSTTSDAQGHYLFPRLCGGMWRITHAEWRSGSARTTRPVELTPAEFMLAPTEKRVADLTVPPQDGGTLYGKVHLPEDDRQVDVRLGVSPIGDSRWKHGSFSTSADSSGRYEIGELPAGEYRVTAEINVSRGRPGGFTLANVGTRDVKVPSSGRVELDLFIDDLGR